MKNSTAGYLFILLLVLISCQNNSESKHQSALREIALYFESEIQTLEKSDLTLTKKLIHKGTAETIQIDHPDWSKELVPFTETIANQPAQKYLEIMTTP